MSLYPNFSDLLGKTISAIDVTRNAHDEDAIKFATSDGKLYVLRHNQGCCERVNIEDVVGDFEDLIGNPLLVAEDASNSDDPPLPEGDESYTWTYYKLATIKGSVDIRWYGSSNGCYSEDVDFEDITPSASIGA